MGRRVARPSAPHFGIGVPLAHDEGEIEFLLLGDVAPCCTGDGLVFEQQFNGSDGAVGVNGRFA